MTTEMANDLMPQSAIFTFVEGDIIKSKLLERGLTYFSIATIYYDRSLLVDVEYVVK